MKTLKILIFAFISNSQAMVFEAPVKDSTINTQLSTKNLSMLCEDSCSPYLIKGTWELRLNLMDKSWGDEKKKKTKVKKGKK